MKQSTKLLSLVLSLLMAFGCMSVIGNAALVKSEVSWDCIDDADLTAEQVADLALDLVDNDLLAGMETIDLSIVGELRLDSLDHIAADIDELTGGFIWAIGKGLLGDVGDMNFDAIAGKQRSGGDIAFINALLQFLADNASIVGKVAYGIGTDNGISLGLIGNFLDLGDIGDKLGNIPLLLIELVYDMLVYGSYGYDMDVEDLTAAGQSLPTDMDTLDEIVNNALLNLLINPQDYTWEGEGDAAVKVWDMGSFISPSLKAYVEANGRANTISEFSPLSNSLFEILDFAAPFAIDDIAINALNNNLKKALMLACEAELLEIDETSLPASVATEFETTTAEAEKSYVTYLAYDKLAKSGNTWYYTTLETEVEKDGAGNPVLDEEGNEVTYKARKYFKVNMAAANEFANLINWDWEFVGSDVEPAEGQVQLSYDWLIQNGSIASGINDLIGLVYENGLTDAAKTEFEGFIGAEAGEGWMAGNENINDNVMNVTKYILVNFGDRVFGSDSAYANLAWEDIESYTIIDLVALIGPEFFEDAMPQIILPKNADGSYAFHEGVQVWEFAAIVLRELITGIAPNVNYDAYIFANGDVTSVDDRLFVEDTDADYWFNLLLNMGMDLACEYLINITNFRDFCAAEYGAEFDLDAYIANGGGTDPAHWEAVLDAAILWAVEYVGQEKSSSVLNGLDYNTIKAVSGPFNKLSKILNTLLPLGIIQGYQSTDYALDVALLVDGIKELLTSFDLNLIINLFGRGADAYNFLEDVSLVAGVLDLVNGILSLVFRSGILNGFTVNRTNPSIATVSLDTVVSQANLKTTVQTLLTQLNASKSALLLNALPVVGKLIKGWGTEQSFNEPEITLGNKVELTAGATTADITVNIRNASDGVWRHYRDEAGNEYTDAQYQIKPVQVLVFDEMGEGTTSNSAYVTITAQPATTAVDYGQSATFTYAVANVPTSGKLVRFEVQYQVLDEDGALMANGKVFKTANYVWFNYDPDNTGSETYFNNNGSLTYAAIFAPHYVPLSTATDFIPEITTGKFGRDYKLFTSKQTGAITASTQTIDGITFGNVTMDFSNVSGGRYFNGLQQFKTYTVQATNEDGEIQSGSGNALTVSGSVNAATWAAANKTSGSNTTWSVTLTAKSVTNGPHNFSLYYYDDYHQSLLSSLAVKEMEEMRLASTYNLSGTVYANGLLTTANTTDAEGNPVYRDSNFSTTAWIAQTDCGKWAGTDSAGKVYTVTEYAEANVTGIIEEKDEDDNVIGATGYVTVGEDKISVRKVTKIDCATAIGNYVPAWQAGIQGGMQSWNANSVYNFQALYENFYVASNDVSYCKKSAEQLVSEGQGDNVSTAIAALEANLQAVEEEYTYDYDFTDYKMYRLNRLNDVRDDAHAVIQLADDAAPATVAEIDEYFDYNWMEENDFRALVAGDEYEAYLVALLEKFDAEEIAAKSEWLAQRKADLARQTILDIEIMEGLLDRTSARLLKRAYGVIDTQLVDEIASANNMIGTDASKYTEKSWARYQDALNYANDVVNANGVVKSQKHIFEAKYNLLITRKALVPAGMEADYTELETLIAQAEHALANADLYNNTNKEFGQVLAELGYNEIDDVQLFPGSALLVLAEGYHVDDQDKVDSAADALKEALARLEFKGTTITGNGVTVSESTLVEADEENGIEAVTATTAVIAEGLDAEAVKTLFTVTANNAVVEGDLITVSNDYYYTIDTDLEGFAGTGAVVTFYTVNAGIKIPVATIKVIVKGDINGDGVVDALDGAYAALVESERTELSECYLLAGDLSNSDRAITADDYAAIVNLVVD